MTVEITDIPIARQISMHAITRALLANGPTSRAELAKLTGFSKQTISDVVRDLEDAGWLAPLGRTAGRPGRSAVTYAINGRAAAAGAIDLGGSKVHAAVVDLLGEVMAETVEPTDSRGGPHVIAQIARLLDGLKAGLAPPVQQLQLVVLGTPGVFHPETGQIAAAPNIQGLGEIDMRGALAARLGAPVVIENDVNLAARGEQWRGHGVGIGNFVFIGLGTGIGMGIIADGHLLRGASGGAGEIAYLPIGGDPFDSRGFRLGTLENAIGSVAANSRPRSFGSLKIPTYWIRPSSLIGTPVQPRPVLACSTPCSASTIEHSTKTIIATMTRCWLVQHAANTKKAITVGPNFVNWSSAPPDQPLVTCEIIRTTRKAGRSRNCGAAKVFAWEISQHAKDSISTTGSSGTPTSIGM